MHCKTIMLEYSAGKYSSSQQSFPPVRPERPLRVELCCSVQEDVNGLDPRDPIWTKCWRWLLMDQFIALLSTVILLLLLLGRGRGRETGSTHYRMLCYGWSGSCYKTQQETTDDDDDGGASSPSNLLPGLPKEESRISLWIVSSHITKNSNSSVALFSPRSSLFASPFIIFHQPASSHLISSRVSSLVDAHSSAATVLQAQPPPSASLK